MPTTYNEMRTIITVKQHTVLGNRQAEEHAEHVSLRGRVLGIVFLCYRAQASDFSWRFWLGEKNNWNKICLGILRPLLEWKSKKHTLEVIMRISPLQSHLQRGQFMRLKSWGYPSHSLVLQFLSLPVWGPVQGNGAEDSLPVLCWTCTTTLGTCCFFLENVTSLDFPMLPWTPFSCAKEQLWTPSQMSVTPNGTRNFQ